MRKALGQLFIAILLLSSAPAQLLAHIGLKSSSPAAGAHLGQAPKQLRLDFTETPELTFASIRLLSANGREIALLPLAYYAMHGAAGALDLNLAGAMVRRTMWGWGWLLQLVGVVLAGAGFSRSWWRVATCGAIAAAFSPAFQGTRPVFRNSARSPSRQMGFMC